jgi:hypothetical protein
MEGLTLTLSPGAKVEAIDQVSGGRDFGWRSHSKVQHAAEVFRASFGSKGIGGNGYNSTPIPFLQFGLGCASFRVNR